MSFVGAHKVHALSVLAHVGLAVAVGTIPRAPLRETFSVTYREHRSAVRTPPPPTVAPTPPQHAPEPLAEPTPSHATPSHPAAVRPRTAPPTAPHAAPPPATSTASTAGPSAPDFGIALSGGTGGIAVRPPSDGTPGGGSGGASHGIHTLVRPHPADDCDEAATRPRALSMAQPEYPDRAREAGIEGRVRVELNVDAEGRVTGSRVLQSLGYGLDEAALVAARDAHFEPATRCGHPVSATFVVSLRFAL